MNDLIDAGLGILQANVGGVIPRRVRRDIVVFSHIDEGQRVRLVFSLESQMQVVRFIADREFVRESLGKLPFGNLLGQKEGSQVALRFLVGESYVSAGQIDRAIHVCSRGSRAYLQRLAQSNARGSRRL